MSTQRQRRVLAGEEMKVNFPLSFSVCVLQDLLPLSKLEKPSLLFLKADIESALSPPFPLSSSPLRDSAAPHTIRLFFLGIRTGLREFTLFADTLSFFMPSGRWTLFGLFFSSFSFSFLFSPLFSGQRASNVNVRPYLSFLLRTVNVECASWSFSPLS